MPGVIDDTDLKMLREQLEHAEGEADRMTADNERLRTRLEQIADIAEGSRTINSLPHIAKIAREP